MLYQINKFKSHPLFKQLQDVRVVGLVVFGVIAILVTWSGVGAIETNYGLQQQISKLQQQNNLEQLQNNNLQLQNEYYNTGEYLELQSRQLLGKAAPGEKLILVPQSVALSNLAPIPTQTVISQNNINPIKPFYQTNFEAWINFFFPQR